LGGLRGGLLRRRLGWLRWRRRLSRLLLGRLGLTGLLLTGLLLSRLLLTWLLARLLSEHRTGHKDHHGEHGPDRQ
jgi:hypothetical protein